MGTEQNARYYAGIGSRETPPWIQKYMFYISIELEKKNYTLRSGGADGADTAFELGAGDKKEIFLPWKNFNNRTSAFTQPSERAIEIAIRFHPCFDKLSRGAKLLISRNTHQILGPNCDSPSDFVICWTKDGKASGGTGQALRIAEHYKIPIYNLRSMSVEEILSSIFKQEN